MAVDYETAERQDAVVREASLFERLPAFLATAVEAAPGLKSWLGDIDPATITGHEPLEALPVLRKPDLMALQAESPPFGGFADSAALRGRRVFQSPGPVWEPQGAGTDFGQAARAFNAAGFQPGDIVVNCFAYHMTPGGFILEGGALEHGCLVFPAGTGSTEMQVEAIASLKATGYCGTPDFLKLILDKAAEMDRDLSSLKRALVSGGALFPSLRAEYAARGIQTFQCYATAEFGVIAYESAAPDGSPSPGMVINEDLIVEIVTPGTDDPVPPGSVGELVVTRFNPAYPLVRFGTGDLTAELLESSPCGRTNKRIKGWMGRADQRTKIKGMFVDPKQVAAILRRHPEISKARLVVGREDGQDRMTLKVEADETADLADIESTLRDVTKLGGRVKRVAPQTLPDDGKVIADERDYET